MHQQTALYVYIYISPHQHNDDLIELVQVLTTNTTSGSDNCPSEDKCKHNDKISQNHNVN